MPKKSATPKKTATKKVTPSKTFAGNDPPPFDADKLLLKALTNGIDDEPSSTLEELAARPEGISNNDILDTLGDAWSGGCDEEADGGYYASGGPNPGIWLGMTEKLGKPTLSGEALVTACRRVLNLPDSLTAAARGRAETTTGADDTTPTTSTSTTVSFEQPSNGELPIDKIKVVGNPRESFEEEPLQELANSIKSLGILEPLLVGPAEEDGLHPLIAGERRLRAARMAELAVVPVRVGLFSEDDLEIAQLVENLLRVDLTAIEEAKVYEKALKKTTQRELAVKVGKTQAHISNRVRLLKLPGGLQDDIVSGRIGQREGRELATWADRAAVMREFQFQWNKGFQTFATCLWVAIQATSRSIDKGSDGPLFKLTDDVREKLDIVAVTIDKYNGERAFNVKLWDELQGAAKKKREERKAAKAAKPEGEESAIDPQTVKELWVMWWNRAVCKRFENATSPADIDLLTKLAVCYGDEDPMYSVAKELNQLTPVEVLKLDTTEILACVRRLFIARLKIGMSYIEDLHVLIDMLEFCGVSLQTWVPDEPFLNKLPMPFLRDLAKEYDLEPEKTVPKIVAQLIENWEAGWIHDALVVPALKYTYAESAA